MMLRMKGMEDYDEVNFAMDVDDGYITIKLKPSRDVSKSIDDA